MPTGTLEIRGATAPDLRDVELDIPRELRAARAASPHEKKVDKYEDNDMQTNGWSM